MERTDARRFREEQRLRQWWLRGIIVLVAALSWWAFFAQIVRGQPWGDRPGPDWAIWLLFTSFGLLVPAGILLARLVVTVEDDVVRIRWIPFARKTIRIEDIASCEARAYRPILEYGGWGIRWAGKRGTAWNAHGNRGVQLVLNSGKRVLIGSQRAEELADAIDRARTANSPRGT